MESHLQCHDMYGLPMVQSDLMENIHVQWYLWPILSEMGMKH